MDKEEILGSYESKSDSRKRQYDVAYMDMAKRWSLLSHCKKKQVGALIVKDRMIISDGFNGTISSFDNNCEDETGATNWHTLHAEANAILKLAASTHNSIGATLYITCSPCRDCSKLIYQSGITRVVYDEDYKTYDGVEFLKKAGIQIQKMNEIQNNLTDIIDSFESDHNKNHMILIHKNINKAHSENDFESINKSIIHLMDKYYNDVDLLRSYLVATNSFKEKLSLRNSVYARLVLLYNNLGLKISIENLK